MCPYVDEDALAVRTCEIKETSLREISDFVVKVVEDDSSRASKTGHPSRSQAFLSISFALLLLTELEQQQQQ